MKEENIVCENVTPEKGAAEITVYILPTSDFTHFKGDPKRYKVGHMIYPASDITDTEDLKKSGYKLAKNCFVAFPAYYTQTLYHPPSVMEIDEAHPFVWQKEGEEGIYVDTEGLLTSQ
jgi:hypothetical protein